MKAKNFVILMGRGTVKYIDRPNELKIFDFKMPAKSDFVNKL